MSPTPNLQDLVKSVRDEVADTDPLGQLTKAAELSASLNTLGDRLLDHFVFQCRQAGMSWAELSTALGVSKQAAHKRFTGNSAPNFSRFTDKARSVMVGSQEQARALGHGTVETEHLLLAVFEPADSIAAIVLARLGVQRDAVLDLVLQRKPGEPERPTGAIPFSQDAKSTLRAALDEALALGHNYIGTEHMLLGLFAEPEYGSAVILGQLGQDRATVHSTVQEELKNFVRERARLQAQFPTDEA
jgi:hypothetical protein